MSVINFEVRLREGETSEKLIKRFLKQQKKNDLINEFKSHQYYRKPSEVKREEEKKRLRVIQKIQEEKDNGYRKRISN